MSFSEWLKKSSPYILTGLGVAGMGTATILAVKATPKACYAIEERKEQLGINQNGKLPFKEKVKATWKLYLPSILISAAGAGCIIGSDVMQGKKLAVAGAAYAAATGALATAQQKLIEVGGKAVSDKVNTAIVEEKVQKIEAKEAEVEQKTGKAKEIVYVNNKPTLFLDLQTGRRFTSEIEDVRRAIRDLELEHRADADGFVYVNELYERLDIGTCEFGAKYGFDLNKGKIDISLVPILENDEPVIALQYEPVLDPSLLY